MDEFSGYESTKKQWYDNYTVVGICFLFAVAIGVVVTGFARTGQIQGEINNDAKWQKLSFVVNLAGPAQGRDASHAFQQIALTANLKGRTVATQRLLSWGTNGHQIGDHFTGYVSEIGAIRLDNYDASPLEVGSDNGSLFVLTLLSFVIASILAGLVLAGLVLGGTAVMTGLRRRPGGVATVS